MHAGKRPAWLVSTLDSVADQASSETSQLFSVTQISSLNHLSSQILGNYCWDLVHAQHAVLPETLGQLKVATKWVLLRIMCVNR
jgi:hypothetical protein